MSVWAWEVTGDWRAHVSARYPVQMRRTMLRSVSTLVMPTT